MKPDSHKSQQIMNDEETDGEIEDIFQIVAVESMIPEAEDLAVDVVKRIILDDDDFILKLFKFLVVLIVFFQPPDDVVKRNDHVSDKIHRS
ncbi:unnamed protein product [Caenorhabditis auriculariae]|uniref:Uncharacterized protein n=1 Tax=Caenorhabditis auriculariae TaxID=2777116 RepID=A0A8S1HSN3_9PELO|nr:unnamed protein product [Caenorhabditis auriculariae]